MAWVVPFVSVGLARFILHSDTTDCKLSTWAEYWCRFGVRWPSEKTWRALLGVFLHRCALADLSADEQLDLLHDFKETLRTFNKQGPEPPLADIMWEFLQQTQRG